MLPGTRKPACSPIVALNGNKTPNPTNFSNCRSQLYLNAADVENFGPNGELPAAGPLISHQPPGSARGSPPSHQKAHSADRPLVEVPDRFGRPHLINVSKPVLLINSEFKQRSTKSKVVFHDHGTPKAILPGLHRLEKLSQKLLPPSNDADISITVTTTHENLAEAEEEDDFADSNDKTKANSVPEKPDEKGISSSACREQEVLCEVPEQQVPSSKSDRYLVHSCAHNTHNRSTSRRPSA